MHFESPTVTPDPITTGGNTVVRDHKWFAVDPIEHDKKYDGSEMSLIRASRNDGPLADFVKLFLGHRHAQILQTQTRIYKANAATADVDQILQNNGSWVFVSGIADENLAKGLPLYNTVTLREVLDYSIAHELAHLVINARNANGWTADEHTNPQNGSIMSTAPLEKDLAELKFTAEELSKINLPGRSSVLP